MSSDWNIRRSSRICSLTGQAIEPGTVFFSALREENDRFAREDFSEAAWPEVDKTAFFSYWKSKAPEKDQENTAFAIDIEQVLIFFDRLEAEKSREKQLFRYVIALILARKRVLRLDDIKKTEQGDYLLLYDKRIAKAIEVFSPDASREEVDSLQQELNLLFETDFSK